MSDISDKIIEICVMFEDGMSVQEIAEKVNFPKEEVKEALQWGLEDYQTVDL